MTVVIDTALEEEERRTRRETIARRKRLMRRARAGCVWFVAFSVVAGLATWFFVTAFLFADQRVGERALAETRTGGAPMTQAELAALPPRSREIAEATRLWRKTIELFDPSHIQNPSFAKVPVIGSNRGDDGGKPPDRDGRGRLQGEDLIAAKAFVARFDEAFEAARLARDAGGVANFQAPTGDPNVVAPSAVYEIVLLATVLRLKVETRLAGGDVDGALDDLSTMIAAGDALRYEPYEWQQRSRHQSMKWAVDLVERMLAVEELTDDQLASLSRNFDDRDEAESFRLVVAGSRLPFVDQLQLSDAAFRDTFRIERSSWTRGADLSRGLDIIRRIDEASERSLVEAIDAWKPIDAELAALAAEPAAQVRYPGTLMLLPHFGALAESHLNAEATVTLARTAIACERYRLANGDLPAKLDDLVPEYLDVAPLDPCDGQPLRYVSDAGGVRLYSIGADLVDDGGGGATGSPAAAFAPSDIVFRLKKSRAIDSATQ